jgi:hypothetical protein
MFSTSSLPILIQFFLAFYNDKPGDWLLDNVIHTKVCKVDQNYTKCQEEKNTVWIHYKPGPVYFNILAPITHSREKCKISRIWIFDSWCEFGHVEHEYLNNKTEKASSHKPRIFPKICLLLCTFVYSCLLLFTLVYFCLLLFTFVYFCLLLFTFVYFCLLLFTFVYFCLLL